jgi:hypothetical protein
MYSKINRFLVFIKIKIVYAHQKYCVDSILDFRFRNNLLIPKFFIPTINLQ